MPNIHQRLNRLEGEFRKLTGGVCRLCHGHPFVTLYVMHEPSPNGPGVRPTGERFFVHDDDDERISDDLCCRRCGTPAQQTHLMMFVGLGPKAGGRRLCV
jgi:hypothetical protein